MQGKAAIGKLIEPAVYWIGETCIRREELNRYLADRGNEDFMASVDNVIVNEKLLVKKGDK